MKAQKVLCQWVLAVSVTCGANAAPGIVKTENFDSKASASINGWVEHLSREHSNNYGFSDSDHNGAGPGEGGGALTRTSAARSFYADVFGGQLTADNQVTARGKLTIASPLTDNRIHVGHLDSTLDTVSAKNLLGLFVQEPNRLYAAVGLADGAFVTALVGFAEAGVTYDWNYTYDPAGGATGTGELKVNVEGLGSAVITLIAFQRAIGFSVNAFGLSNPGVGTSAADTGEVYIDNVEYAAVTGLACIQAPQSALSLAGQTNKTLTVSIPGALNATRSANVTITSLHPSIAIPAGADLSGRLTLTFPVGSPTVQSFNLIALKAGTTTLTLTNDQGVCAQNDIAVNVVASQETVLKIEGFANASSARTNGWVEHLSRENQNDYGFSDSNNSGAGAGEAGGALTRTSATRSYYADVFGRRLTLNETISARGKFILATSLTDNRIHVGHLDSAIGAVSTANLLGFLVQEPGRIYAAIGLTNGAVLSTLLGAVQPATVYEWDYTYDPTGSPSGSGKLTLTFAGLGSAVVTLSDADRAIGIGLDAFGIGNPGVGSSAPDAGQVFIDRLQYTALAGLPRIKATPEVVVLVGQTNKAISVIIPGQLNANNEARISIQSADPTIAVPVGANPAGQLILTFPAGAANSQSFNIAGVRPGTTILIVTNEYGVGVENDIIVTVPAPAAVVQKSEAFNTAASAQANGWIEHRSRQDGNNYGFSDSNNTGAGLGEAGGAMTRTRLNRSYYADVFGGRLTLNDAFSARGKWIITTPPTDNRLAFGHLDSSVTNVTGANIIGVTLNEPGRVYASIILADGRDIRTLIGVAEPGLVYEWEYSYDPLGGDTGNGQLTLNVPGVGEGVAVVMLSAEQRALGAVFDAFGLVNPGAGSSAIDAGAMFIDGVEYTAVRAPSALLEVTKIELTPAGKVRLMINSPAPAQPHAVQETASLAAGVWTDMTGVAFSTPTGNEFTAEFPRPASSPRFYRVALRP